MVTIQKQESSTKNSNPLVYGVVILAIFVIGQYAAMYLPANNGNAPKLLSLFNSILWSSLFFLSLWKLLGMKKIYGFILGILVGSISFFGASFMAKENLLNALYSEYVQWYIEIANKGGHIPRSISGVDKNGNQFIFVLEGFNLDHIERDNFIKVILKEELSTHYAYGTLMNAFNDESEMLEEELNVITASAERYIYGVFTVLRSESGSMELKSKGVWEGDDPENYPGMWFLSNPPVLPDVDLKKYVKMWKASRNEAFFKQR
jgi:hypothetical protein